MNTVARNFYLVTVLLLGVIGGQAQSQYRVGDVVQNFTVTDRATGEPASLEDLKGSIVFLEWFAYWCPFCQAAAQEIGPGIVEYYADQDGNFNGLPVRHIALNLEPNLQSSTQAFINFYGLQTVWNDFDRAVANRFHLGGQPLFAIINLVEDSPTHHYGELLYTASGYGDLNFPIQTFRQAIDRVQAAEPNPEPEPDPEPTVAPTFALQPVAQTVRTGRRASFVAGVLGEGVLAYQWSRNGMNLPTQQDAVLQIEAVSTADIGDYAVTVTNLIGSVTSAGARLALDDTAAGRLVNLSANAFSGMDADQLVPSFVAVGSVRLLVRAVGPTLAGFGVSETLVDPEFEIRDGEAVLGANQNWSDRGASDTISATAAVVGGFPLLSGSGDAAAIYDYDGGPRSVPVTEANGGTGTALVEVYEVPTAGRDGRLVNLATRGVVQSGKTLVAGFVIGGTGARTVLIRGIGPALGAFGVPGVLADPQMSLASGGVVLTSNDDWAGDPFGEALVSAIGGTAGAFPLPSGSADAALVITLSPGPYTVQITGKGDAVGVVLTEIYDVTDI